MCENGGGRKEGRREVGQGRMQEGGGRRERFGSAKFFGAPNTSAVFFYILQYSPCHCIIIYFISVKCTAKTVIPMQCSVE